jgi:hypothetical protein
MINSRIIQNLMRIGRRKVFWDSRRRDLNPQYLRTMGKFLSRDFLLKVYINIVSHLRGVIKPLENP